MAEQLNSAGEELARFCERLAYTMETLAQELGVSRATVFNWKKDQRGLPRMVSLALRALEIDPALRGMSMKTEKKPRKQYRRRTDRTIVSEKRHD
jgi:DNA-binding XRE family transcriptional regulator